MLINLRTLALSAAVLAVPTIASATGGLGCGVDDEHLSLQFESLFSYSDIGGLFQISGEIEVKDKRVHASLQKFTLADSDLKQQWFRDDDVKLMLYREISGNSEPYSSVKLIIEATKPPEEDFGCEGKYKLTFVPADAASDTPPVTVEGKVGCSAG